jgi:two-component system, chemotaxis family, protein-glutamate methylesterase/glutaminase
MKKYSVLVADDSAVMRKKICELVEQHEQLYIVARARNGIDLVEKANNLRPDILIVDVEMPEMNGLEAIQLLMKTLPTPSIVISNNTKHEEAAYLNGAIHFISKRELFEQSNEAQNLFLQLVFSIAESPIEYHGEIDDYIEEVIEDIDYVFDKRILVIGSSTGGPSALQKILSNIPVGFPVPILIIQHIPVGFTKALATRFNNICSLNVKEAEHEETLKKGNVYIAPAGNHAIVQVVNNHYEFNLEYPIEQEYLYKPAIDATLMSLGSLAKDQLQVVILTGMGNDGLAGCKHITKFGGKVFAEAEETCVVFGMPKVVIEAKLAEKVVPIYEMANEINRVYL